MRERELERGKGREELIHHHVWQSWVELDLHVSNQSYLWYRVHAPAMARERLRTHLIALNRGTVVILSMRREAGWGCGLYLLGPTRSAIY